MAMPAVPLPVGRDVSRSAYVQHLQAQRVATTELNRVLGQAAKDAERLVSRLATQESISASIRSAQLAAVRDGLEANQLALFGNVERITHQGTITASKAATDGQERLAQMLTRSGADPRLATQFQLAARYSAENVRAKYLADIKLSERVYKNSQLMTAKANNMVARGLATGKSAREIAADVRGFISPNTPGGSAYAAKRLARTEINNAFHTVSTESMVNSPFVIGAKWELSGSHPRPDDCDDYAEDDPYQLGAGVYPPEGIPQKPHPQCLCYTVAITPPIEEVLSKLEAGDYDDWLEESGLDILGRETVTASASSAITPPRNYQPVDASWGEQFARTAVWSKAQQASLRSYTSREFEPINRYLRTGSHAKTGKAPAAAKKASLDKRIENISSSMRPLDRDVVVRRGADLNAFGGPVDAKGFSTGLTSGYDPSHMVGKTFTDKGFTSTTVKQTAFRRDVDVVVRAPQGTRAAYVEGVTARPGEMELLIDRGTTFRVMEAKRVKAEKPVFQGGKRFDEHWQIVVEVVD